ncbi:MAG: hypothetical protein HQ567_12460 [Candidatus Nealsonbacteria bacterium]|nr:hypothetical protein [Candidatus Nealsonbacteria bacterium]
MNQAHFYLATPAADGNLAVIELNYNPANPTPDELAVDPTLKKDQFEFIEFLNLSDERIDLTRLEFQQGVEFDFTSADVGILEPGQYGVLVADRAAFEIRYQADVLVIGEYEGNLDDGERLALRSAIDFEFDDANDWPHRADGKGATLELISPSWSPRYAYAWRSSSEYGGSPGAMGTGPGEWIPRRKIGQGEPRGSSPRRTTNRRSILVRVNGATCAGASPAARGLRSLRETTAWVSCLDPPYASK